MWENKLVDQAREHQVFSLFGASSTSTCLIKLHYWWCLRITNLSISQISQNYRELTLILRIQHSKDVKKFLTKDLRISKRFHACKRDAFESFYRFWMFRTSCKSNRISLAQTVSQMGLVCTNPKSNRIS